MGNVFALAGGPAKFVPLARMRSTLHASLGVMMTSSLRVGQWIVVVIAAAMSGLVAGVVGLLVGATYGGNYCNNCEFNGERGYEATGQIGFLVGAPIGLALPGWGVYSLFRRRNSKSRRD